MRIPETIFGAAFSKLRRNKAISESGCAGNQPEAAAAEACGSFRGKDGLNFVKRLLILFVLLLTAVLMTAADGRAESFLIISDLHLSKGQEHEAARKAVIQAAREKDAVLMLGDNTNNAHAEEHALVLKWAKEIRQQTGAEVYIIPGNHDYRPHFGPDEFSLQYRSYGWGQSFSRDYVSASYAVMTENGTCLLMMDTNQPDRGQSAMPYGGIWDSTLEWVREVLASLPDGTPVLACGHHPILPQERNDRTPGAYALSQILRAYGVGLYLCGHDHGFATVEAENLHQITVGQPQAFPGRAGIVKQEQDGFLWQTEALYDEQSPDFLRLQEDTYSLGRRMGRGTLAATQYAEDEAAAEWFASAFMLFAGGEMTPEKNAGLLADENCQKWRRIETRTVVKDWILNLLENPPADVRHIIIPSSRKHPME